MVIVPKIPKPSFLKQFGRQLPLLVNEHQIVILKNVLLSQVDLVENDGTAAVVAKSPIQTALAVANFYLYIIRLPMLLRSSMIPRAVNAIIIITIINFRINICLTGLFAKKKDLSPNSLLYIQCTAVLAGVIPAYDLCLIPIHQHHPLHGNLCNTAEMS